MPRPRSVRRSLASRCFGTLLAFWFAISIAEPQWLHACPMHTAAVAPGAAQSAGHPGHAPGTAAARDAGATGEGHAAHAGHAAGVAPATHDPAPTPGDRGGDRTHGGSPAHDHGAAHCLCIGDCAPGAVLTLATVPEVPVATVVVIEPRGALPRADYVPVVRERTLPFATAPPAL